MFTKETVEQLGSCRENLEDPRWGKVSLHDFDELLVIALCSALCGGLGGDGVGVGRRVQGREHAGDGADALPYSTTPQLTPWLLAAAPETSTT